MNTISIWLLVSLGSTYGPTGRPTVTIERFATREDCVATAEALNRALKTHSVNHYCVPAKVLKP